MTSGSNWRHLYRPTTAVARSISVQLLRALVQSCNTSRIGHDPPQAKKARLSILRQVPIGTLNESLAIFARCSSQRHSFGLLLSLHTASIIIILYIEYIVDSVHCCGNSDGGVQIRSSSRQISLPASAEKAACSPRQIPVPSEQSSSPESQKRISRWTNQLYGRANVFWREL
jgi:hypothetical protein